ncbi:MAG: allantoate amidohydrolase [Burkholderiales bacterium]|nr:allantoate amidohydrolase [Burkholderiales bacterium]
MTTASAETQHTFDSLSHADRVHFVNVLGGIFEHSPWVAEIAWKSRPFSAIEALHAAMVDAVSHASVEAQLALICAHPELAGTEAAAGVLTRESKTEQASAGLDRCTAEELARLRTLNKAYREKFGFPFVMAVKHRSKYEIFKALTSRVANAREPEFATCLTEIGKIGRLRLETMLQTTPASRISAQRIWDRCEALALCSETTDALTRIYLSEQQRAANAHVQAWMQEAGMATHFDAIGNIVGRYEGTRPGMPCLMLGSHLDTVRDAGKYDGMLGVVAAIECVHALNASGTRLPVAIEVVGFADEEGVRFSATLLGSRAIAGTFDASALDKTDRDDISMRDAISQFGLDPSAISTAARQRHDVAAFVELHIEQGPVLEAEGLAVGVVTAINGFCRSVAEIHGMAGHAGTVPMHLRKDTLAAAAECVLAIESLARATPDLVATVGQIEAFPGAINVIPGRVRFTIDVRSPRDQERVNASIQIEQMIEKICVQRNLTLSIVPMHEGKTAACAPWLMSQLGNAIAAENIEVRSLPSGAGHDGMAIIAIADIAMLFVRCKAGISHNPAEAITLSDIEVSTRVFLRFIENFKPQSTSN